MGLLRERSNASVTPPSSALVAHCHHLKSCGWVLNSRDVGEADFEGEELEMRGCLLEMEAHFVLSSPKIQCGGEVLHVLLVKSSDPLSADAQKTCQTPPRLICAQLRS